MGFGKKRKKKEEVQDVKPVVQKVDIKHNPLYPPKQESELKEIVTAVGVAAVCLVLTGVIVTKFSYSYNTSSMASQQSPAAQEDYQESPQESSGENDQEEVGAEDMAEGSDTDSQEQAETEEAGTDGAENKDYIIADSDSRVISVSELEGLSEVELSRARNEIYARHGRKFQDPSLQEYFNAKDWYHGTIEPEQFTEEMLNSTEKANTETILSYEKSKGYK